ncbi:MAG TPA: TIGR03364 family FAD-dependent oxidoreductase, partial [Beijerinckiaceae bacterium]|nr:TIGR03364 family FAD-dependent oxidoreductase [Beijerinckiaceae bacterium]
RPPVVARWIGTYASLPDRPVLVDAPARNLRVVTVTSGTGMSTAFALAEETLADLLGARADAA